MKTFLKISTLILLFFSFSFSPIERGKKIDIKNFDSYKLEKIVIRRINKLRKKKKAKKLKKNDVLRIAGQDHSNYLSMRKKLTHFQNNKKKKSAMKRVEFYQGNFDGIAENIASTFIFKPVVNPENNETIIIETYRDLGEHLFQLWKNSKDHYKIMIDDTYSLTGIGFTVNSKTKRICTAQVFGYKKD